MDLAIASNSEILTAMKTSFISQANDANNSYVFSGFVEKYHEGEWLNVITEEVLIILKINDHEPISSFFLFESFLNPLFKFYYPDYSGYDKCKLGKWRTK